MPGAYILSHFKWSFDHAPLWDTLWEYRQTKELEAISGRSVSTLAYYCSKYLCLEWYFKNLPEQLSATVSIEHNPTKNWAWKVQLI